MTKNKPRDKIGELAQKYIENKISFSRAYKKAINVTKTQNDFKRLLDILNTTKNAPKTKGCKLDTTVITSEG